MGILDKGEAMGERALLATSVYRRPYTAIAERETTLLEFGAQHIPHIETIVPNFALKVLQSNILKLDRANELIRVLRKTHPIERVIHFLLFFIHHYGSKSPQGIELEISGPEIAIWTSVDEEICEECLGELVNRKALDKKKNAYVVKDENLLTQWSFHLKERIAV